MVMDHNGCGSLAGVEGLGVGAKAAGLEEALVKVTLHSDLKGRAIQRTRKKERFQGE